MDREKANTATTNTINCPLLYCEIADDACFEINLVVNSVAVESFVREATDWEKARATCLTCPVSFYPH